MHAQKGMERRTGRLLSTQAHGEPPQGRPDAEEIHPDCCRGLVASK